jgi:hypothetical protein
MLIKNLFCSARRTQPHGRYGAVACAVHVQMYTNDAKALGYELSPGVSHPTAT